MADPKIKGMSQDTYNKVEPWAKKYGVPDEIWMAIAGVESGGNPRATNPSGAYGLFQLLVGGGQGDTAVKAGHTKEDLLDPGINAEFAMPAIAAAYNQIFKSTPGHPGQPLDDNNAWIQFASISGHPGGSPNNSYTRSVGLQLSTEFNLVSIAKLKDGYAKSFTNYNNVSSTTQAIDDAVSNSIPTIADTLSGIQQILSIVSLFSLENIKAALLKTGLFIIAALLVVVGFIIIARQPGGKSE